MMLLISNSQLGLQTEYSCKKFKEIKDESFSIQSDGDSQNGMQQTKTFQFEFPSVDSPFPKIECKNTLQKDLGMTDQISFRYRVVIMLNNDMDNNSYKKYIKWFNIVWSYFSDQKINELLITSPILFKLNYIFFNNTKVIVEDVWEIHNCEISGESLSYIMKFSSGSNTIRFVNVKFCYPEMFKVLSNNQQYSIQSLYFQDWTNQDDESDQALESMLQEICKDSDMKSLNTINIKSDTLTTSKKYRNNDSKLEFLGESFEASDSDRIVIPIQETSDGMRIEEDKYEINDW